MTDPKYISVLVLIPKTYFVCLLNILTMTYQYCCLQTGHRTWTSRATRRTSTTTTTRTTRPTTRWATASPWWSTTTGGRGRARRVEARSGRSPHEWVAGLGFNITSRQVSSVVSSQTPVNTQTLEAGPETEIHLSTGRCNIKTNKLKKILHGVDPLSYFSFQPVLHDWCNKGRGMCYPGSGT